MPRTNLGDQFSVEQRKAWQPKIICRNTFRFTQDGETVIRLHSTDIVRKLADGSVVLNCGGWKSATTKDRMNSHLPAGYRLSQERGVWSVNGVPYFDGMNIPYDVVKPQKASAKAEKTDLALRASIRKFVAKCDKFECLPAPSSGDCWFCSMVVSSPEKDKGKSLGDASGNHTHIREHVKQGYLHGSLILNALKWAGYRDPSLIWQMSNADLKRGEKPSMVKRALKRYLYRQCGLAA